MSYGLPVVAAYAGGVPDIIPAKQEGKTGYLFTPRDLDDCLNNLATLLDDISLREKIRQAAQVEMEKYDWRGAIRVIKHQQYNGAIWFWRNNFALACKIL
ncbi:hypothetical protein L2E82_36493 [Cichorium intybus]|uniref:Uncharacterized protein n=1 Tax=Cichorium intybus TaxID=13427 RepID=A0ACB9BRU1_CICIN|nr:hypothetical protein L2E82_36493 [Cichorium intybus]